MDAFLCIDKPRGLSSFGVVGKVRKLLGERRVGHGGTLDPDATGVLVVALGKATRLLQYLPLQPKCYEFGVQFGVETDTLDSVGTVVKSGERIPSEQELLAILPGFVGEQLQEPPRYSAVKIDGERAYALARKDVSFEMKSKPVTISELEMVGYDASVGAAQMRTVCTAGTYVRSIARDVAARLGTVAHTTSIRRTAVGRFGLDRCVAFDRIETEARGALISMAAALPGMPSVTLDEQRRVAVCQGRAIASDGVIGQPEFGSHVAALGSGGELVAILSCDDGALRPVCVVGK